MIKTYEKQKDRMAYLIDRAGRKCKVCGLVDPCDALYDFHHRDPSRKLFSVGQISMTRSWESILDEVDKCDLLCSNCHRRLHAS